MEMTFCPTLQGWKEGIWLWARAGNLWSCELPECEANYYVCVQEQVGLVHYRVQVMMLVSKTLLNWREK